MIPQITEINFPSYATLHEATGSFADMGERTITTQVRIDGDVVPEFDGWELEFKGERFVLPVKEPQAQKNNTTRNSLVDLTFYSWPIYQMKRFFFFETTTTATGTVMADKYQASVNLNLVNFVSLFNRVLNYYFDGKIVADLATGSYGTEVAAVQLNYSYIWDVLQDFYSLFKVRWYIEYNSSDDVYYIKIGYPATVINDHDFEYGYEGGLLHFERQVQDDNIKNILLGRGGEKNLPYRYFKATDPNNPEWAADPDAIPELANIYFDRLRDLNFRSYVQGWKAKHYGGTYDASRAARDWAYQKGYTDETFDPVEYVKDDESILKYGERWGALDDNDNIFPTIQGITLSGLGRVDEVVAVSEIVTDDVMDLADKSAVIESLHGVMSQVDTIPALQSVSKQIRGETFEVPTGLTANVQNNGFFAKAPSPNEAYVNVDEDYSRIRIYNASTGTEVVSGSAGLPAGTYYYVIDITVVNTASSAIANVTYGVNGLDLVRSDASAESWKPTFDIWVKNLWQTTQGVNESDEDYALRVWGPILGDRLGNEAKIVFSDGFMAVSDYEFVIASYPVPDRSKVIGSYNSEWKITLYKSDAEYEVSGLYIPNNTSGGKPIAGDHFFFIGIDMPYLYVTLAEERLNTFKTAALGQMKDVNPTWVIHLDKIRINELRGQQEQSLFDRISAGCEMHVRDKRFTGNEILRLFANSITYTWQEPTNDNPYILPDVEIVVSDHIVVEKSTVEKMQGDLDVLKATYAKMSDMEAVIQQVASPMFLRKTGEQDTSLSPTKFASVVTSRDFRQGGFGGRGWGLYRDNSSVYQPEAQAAAAGNRSAQRRAATRSGSNENDSEEQATDAVLEIDKLVVRKEMQVNSLVVNQITYVGGKQIISAANIECVQVVETDSSYICYFDQKQGSVKNLFQVNDIAMGQVFSPENVELRYYKMVVTAIDIDSITLAKAGRDGSGAPQKGDVIVQYGNTTDTDRQYVIIRDVIGGGYERMLSGLNATTATGEEYYFAGFDGSESSTPGVPVGPRFFVGGQNSNMQFKESEAQLAIKGVITQSQSGDEFVVSCFRGDYDSTETYYYGDEVNTSDGGVYVYINKTTPSTNRTPSNDGVYWKQKRAPGASGYNTAVVYLYKRSASAPSIDWNYELTYSFPDKALTSVPSGWSQTIPAHTGDPLYVTAATASSRSITDTIAAGEWATPVMLSEDGTTGQSSFKSIVFRRVNASSVTTPTGGSYSSPYPTTSGWSDGVPSGDAQLWMSTRIFTSDGQSPQQSSWTTPQPVTDTADIDFEFSAVETSPGNPTNNPSNWHNTATSSDIWMAVRKCENGTWGNWEITKIKGEKGLNGQSSFKSIIFKRSNNTVTAPSGGSYASPLPSPLNDWSDGVPSGEAQLWMSTRIFTSDGESPQQSVWSTPRPVTDTADIDFEFSAVETNPGNPTNNPSNWHNTATSSDIWMAVRKCENGVWGSWEINKIKGEDGLNSATVFLYRRASSTPSKPSGTFLYTFSSGVLSVVSGSLGDWTQEIPSGSDPCYVIQATAISTDATDTISGSEFSNPVKFVEDGARGARGAKLRGPTRWAATNSYESGTTTDFQDIVIDGDYFYLCVVDIVGNSSNPIPGNDIYTGTGSSGHWIQSNRFDFIATQVLFSERAKIDNLLIDYLFTTDPNADDYNPISIVKDTITIADSDPNSSTYKDDIITITSKKLTEQASQQGGDVALTNLSKQYSLAAHVYQVDLDYTHTFATLTITGANNTVTVPSVRLSMPSLPSNTGIVCYYQVYLGERFLDSGSLSPNTAKNVGGGTFSLPIGSHAYTIRLSGSFYIAQDHSNNISLTISGTRNSANANIAYSNDYRTIATNGAQLLYGYEGIKITPIVNGVGGAKVIQGGNQYNMLGGDVYKASQSSNLVAPKRIVICDDYPSSMSADVLYIKVS